MSDLEAFYMTLALQLPKKKRRIITLNEVQDSIRILCYDRQLILRRKRRKGNGIYIPPIVKLPRQILINILSRLPTKSTLACLSVCKTWEKLISTDQEFAKLQFSRSSAKEVMIRPDGPGSFSRKALLIDPTDNYFEAYAKLALPLSDALTWSGIDIVNACNGLICLCKYLDKNPIVICNPVTREYVNIPRTSPVKVRNVNPIACECSLCLDYNKNESEETLVASGFGYAIKGDQYKVIRVLCRRNSSHGFGGLADSLGRLAEVYTIGEGKWRRTIGFSPQIPHSMSYGTYLKGKFFWACTNDEHVCEFIVSFDFDGENFEFVMPPPSFNASKRRTNQVRMKELRGCLCLCDFSAVNYFEVWVAEEFGGKWLWQKAFVVHMWHGGLVDPLKFVTKEEILMIQKNSKALVVYNALTKRIRYREIQGTHSSFEAIIYAPSFFSLKDIVKEDDQMEVLIVK